MLALPLVGWGDPASHLPCVSDPSSLLPIPNAAADVKAFHISLGKNELFLPRWEQSPCQAWSGPLMQEAKGTVEKV